MTEFYNNAMQLATKEEEEEEEQLDDYWQEYELYYSPNIVRWIKSNHLQSLKIGERHSLLVSGSDHWQRNYLQTFIYGTNAYNETDESRNNFSVSEDNKIELDSPITDIQFADNQTAIIVMQNGEIQAIKMEHNDDCNDNYAVDDQKMINKNTQIKWNLFPMQMNEKLICYPNGNEQRFPAQLTSVAVSTIRGNISVVAADQTGYLYKTEIDQQKKCVSTKNCCSSSINCIRFANNDCIASVCMSGQFMLWDLRDLNTVCFATALPKRFGSLTSLAVHPHRNHIFATGTEEGTIAIWDIRGTNQNLYKLLSGHSVNTLVKDIQFVSNNANATKGLVSCGNDGFAHFYQTSEDHLKTITDKEWMTNSTAIQEESYPVVSVDFNEPLSVVATCCDSQTLSFIPI